MGTIPRTKWTRQLTPYRIMADLNWADLSGEGDWRIIAATSDDGRLYCLGERGTMGLLEASPDEYRMLSSFEIPNAGNQTWAHPAIADGRLYLRREDKLFIYDIGAQ